MKKIVSCLFAVAVGTVGCASPMVGQYAVSPDVQVSLQDLHDRQAAKMTVGQFTPAPQVRANDGGVSCRALTINAPPDRATFTRYVQMALWDELRVARLFDAKADTTIDGVLTSLDETSTGDPAWTLGARFVVKRAGRVVFDKSVTTTTPFVGSFLGDSACQNAAQAFPMAVQRLITKLVRTPAFAAAVAPKVSAQP